MTPPREASALPPLGSIKASPKAISGRTSYLRVRLEFLPYPHLIATLFNGCACGPPKPIKAPSSWMWVDHPVSGSHMPTCALLRLGLPADPQVRLLILPAPVTRRTVLQKVRGCTLTCFRSLWARGFRFSFTPLPGSFSPFPHGTNRYRSLRVFSLGGWSPLLPARFHVSRSTLVPPSLYPFTRTGLSPSLAGFPKTVLLKDTCIMVAHKP